MDKNTVISFDNYFNEIEEPRRVRKGNFLYPLKEILFLSICAVISNSDGWEAIANFGESKLDWLRKFYPYKNGTPSHDTLAHVFSKIDTKKFNLCFVEWINSISEITNGEVIPIDGKTIRRSNDKNENKSPFHLVSAYASDRKLCLGQEVVHEKSNEITAIPKLLDLLCINGCIVTIDAMGCQQNIAAKIIDENADYLLMVKDNQKALKEQIQKLFKINHNPKMDEMIDAGHGRVEKRVCEVINNLDFLDDKQNWKNLNSIAKISTERYDKSTGKTSNDTRYYISSLNGDAKLINYAARKHWGIENNLHWELDVTYKEDLSLMKKGNSPANYSIILKMAMALISKSNLKPDKSKKSKRHIASLDDKFRESLVFNS
jgi:predicted transposase YbfD/YdcC